MFKRFFAITAIALIAGCSQTPQEKAQKSFDRAVQLLEDGKTARADTAFRQLIADAPNSPMGMYGTGLVLERQCQIYDALGVYLKVNKLDRRYAPPLMSMGRVFRLLHEYDLAAAAYRECAFLPDSPAVAMTRMAAVAADDWRPGQVFKSIKTADSLGADKHFYALVRARALAQRLKLDSAEALYTSAVAGAKKTAEFWTLVADYLETRGEVDSAIQASERSTAQDDSRFEHSYAHFQRCMRLHYWWAARQCMKKMAGPDSTNLTRIGTQIQYGVAARDTHLANRANGLFMKYGNNSVTTYVNDADVRLLIGDYQSITQNTEYLPTLAIENNDTSAFVRYLQGMVLIRYPDLSDPPTTAAKLAATTGFAADRRDYKLAYLSQLYIMGATEPLQASIKILEAGHGNETDWLTGFGNAAGDWKVRRYDEAEAYYKRALKIDSTYAPAVRRAVAMSMRGLRYDKALAFLDEFHAVSETYPDLALNRAECLVQTGQIEAGANLFQSAYPKVRGDLRVVESMSRLLQRKGRPDLDGSLLRLVLTLNNGNADAFLLVATRDNDYGNLQDALESAEQGLAVEPDNAHLLVQKARAIHGKGDRQAAYAQLDDLAKRYSEDVEVNLYYSAMLAEDREQLPRAENLARAANIWEQGSRRVVGNLSSVYLQTGRYDQAAAEAQSALNVHPEWSEIQYICGAALCAQGKKEGKGYLQKALDLGLPSNLSDKAKELLSKM